jgi:tonB-linked outer membrane protein, susC/ragA family
MMKQVKCKTPVRMLALMLGLFLSINAFAQSTIKGMVKDSSGEPIISASVLVTGTHEGVQTDIDGNFELNVAPGTQLTISYIGYIKQQVAAKNGMVIVMQPEDAQQMQEVVVIGYGAVKKSDLTGSVLAMKPDTKNKGLVVNAQDMMQGKMAGVNVTGEGGTPGGGAKIRIRGGSSLSASNDPLIVIDGVAMDNTGIKGMSNPLSLVNPQDIESFNVLKDASATAIYGSRGSNGVIIITTKKGRVEKPH